MSGALLIIRRMAVKDEMRKAAAQAPPNLRKGSNGKACATCRHFRASSMNAGRCMKYGGYPVRPTQVSDAYAPAAAQKEA